MTIIKRKRPPHVRPVVELQCSGVVGSRMWRAGWAGLTLPLPVVTVIFYWGSTVEPLTRVHEWTHVAQIDRLGWWRFAIKYWQESRNGYRGNVFEVAAYAMQDSADRLGIPAWAKEGA